MANQKYKILDDGRRLPTGGPLKDEYYGPAWQLVSSCGKHDLEPIVIVPDPGDGTQENLALRILEMLNSNG
jgi:hypothetical protein